MVNVPSVFLVCYGFSMNQVFGPRGESSHGSEGSHSCMRARMHTAYLTLESVQSEKGVRFAAVTMSWLRTLTHVSISSICPSASQCVTRVLAPTSATLSNFFAA